MLTVFDLNMYCPYLVNSRPETVLAEAVIRRTEAAPAALLQAALGADEILVTL